MIRQNRTGDCGIGKGRIDLIRDDFNFSFGNRLVKGRNTDLLAAHDAIDNPLVVGGKHLGSTGPVNFHCIVAGRVVAGGDHDAAVTLLGANCK